jgi:glycosyltransferase involved in cell wall biosynthesis
MSKKILLISSNSSGRGGGERYLVYLTQGLKQLGYDVHCLLSNTSYMDNWAKLLSEEGATVHRHSLVGLKDRPLRFLQSIIDIKQQRIISEFCQSIKPDGILVNQQYDEDGLDYLAGALKAKVAPVAGIIHMPMTENKNERPLGELRGALLKMWYESHIYKLIFVSDGSKKEFEDYYNITSLTNVVNSGLIFSEKVDLNNFKKPDTWQNSIPVFGFIGQFSSQKNLKLLVNSWLKSISSDHQSYLLLVGDGEERNAIEKLLISEAPEGSWHITGWQDHPEKYLPLIDIFLMTSHFEGLPLALIEAAGYGIPTVITNFNGATDVAKKASWVKVVNQNDPNVIGQMLQEHILNLSALKLQANNGREEFQQYFSVKRMAEDTINALGLK